VFVLFWYHTLTAAALRLGVLVPRSKQNMTDQYTYASSRRFHDSSNGETEAKAMIEQK
jgi:hypothetical protein